jgi:hypothetical protein
MCPLASVPIGETNVVTSGPVGIGIHKIYIYIYIYIYKEKVIEWGLFYGEDQIRHGQYP